jgi:putative membrane protein
MAVIEQLPYCGTAPIPGALLDRFNLDPVLIVTLIVGCVWQWIALRRGQDRYYALGGWLVAAAAFLSPLCALSVSLFSARVAQHMVLILAAAPLIAMGWPRRCRTRTAWALWASTVIFFVTLWIWHMPAPYGATFESVGIYWAMHLTLFGSAVWLWRELLHHPGDRTLSVLAAGTLTFVHMGFLGAILAFADHAMFKWHFSTTQIWGFTPLQDQQLGGIFMWVPGTALFLWTAIRSVARLWQTIERPRPA